MISCRKIFEARGGIECNVEDAEAAAIVSAAEYTAKSLSIWAKEPQA